MFIPLPQFLACMNVTEGQYEKGHREEQHPKVLHFSIPFSTGLEAAGLCQ
jgi:hypothetical protein